MCLDQLLPDADVLACDGVQITGDQVRMTLRATSAFGLCPLCQLPSTRTHSRYRRQLRDLPWQGTTVRLDLEVRRFFCSTPSCPRRIFAERVPRVAATFARKTCRLAQALKNVAFTCGGEAGSRLAVRLGMPTSPDTLLRTMRNTTIDQSGTPRVLGVDEWAIRRGFRYGTILCDLEQHRPVDVLAERSAESFADWLRQHPGVEIVCRDRSGTYARGASAGAPNATQVSDRWHLLDNLREALVRVVDRHHREVQQAVRLMTPIPLQAVSAVQPQARPSTPQPPSRAKQLQEARRTRRMQRYTQVLELHTQGLSQRNIARRAGINRETVTRYLRAGAFPERGTRQRRGMLDEFSDFLHQRWGAGCRNAAQLARELRGHGFGGSYHTVRRFIARWRHAVDAACPSAPGSADATHTVMRTPSSDRVVTMLLKKESDLTSQEQAFIENLWLRCSDVRKAARLGRQFVRMVNHRQPEKLTDWITRARDRGVPEDLKTFAQVLRADHSAVQAGLALDWSNGQVEGQINRLKLIKRQMYGRANFDLLRQRVLYAG